MQGAKRKRCEPSDTPSPSTSATLSAIDSPPATPLLSHRYSSQRRKKLRADLGFLPERILSGSPDTVTKEGVHNMPSFPKEGEEWDARRNQAHIHSRTRCMMRVHTDRMSVLASRDYQRQQYAPTRHTIPALRKRRYSIDVNDGVEKRPSKRVSHSLVCGDDVSTSRLLHGLTCFKH